MIKRLAALFSLFIILFVGLEKANANHMMGGDMYYTYIGPTPGNALKNRFQLTAVVYRNCNAGRPQMESSYPFGVYNGLTNVLVQTVTLPQISFQQLTQYAPGCNYPTTVCIEEGVYQGFVDVPNNLANNPGFHVSMYSYKRNANINNLNLNAGNQDGPNGMIWYCYLPPNGITNSSPRFLAKPLPYMCVNREFRFNHNGFDPDGDSLVFSLAYPYGSIGTNNNGSGGAPQGVVGGVPNATAPAGQPNNPTPPGANLATTFWFGGVQYATGYSYPNNTINTINPPGIKINSYTGEISLTPTTQGNFVLAVEVKEYRVDRINDTVYYLGSVRRDLQFLVGGNCPNNYAPVVTNIPDSFSVDPGTPLSFNFLVFDAEGDSVIITKQGGIFDNSAGYPPPYAVLNNVSALQAAVGSFSWTPSCAYARVAPYFFSILVRDDQCNATQKTVYIKVNPSPIVQPPKLRCVNVNSPTSITLNWSKPNGQLTSFQQYRVYRRLPGGATWSLIDSVTNVNTLTYTDNSVSNAHLQAYEYRMVSVNKCGEEGQYTSVFRTIIVSGFQYALDRVQITWTRPLSFTTLVYPVRVFRGISGIYNFIGTAAVNDTVYNDKWCTSTVRYQVLYTDSVTGCTFGNYTANSYAIVDSIKPSPASIRVASVLTNGMVNIVINKSDSTDVARYNLFRSVNGGAFNQVFSFVKTGAAVQTLTDSTAPSSTSQLCYYVVAEDICALKSVSSDTECVSLLQGTVGQLRVNQTWSNYRGRAFSTWKLQKLVAGTWTDLKNGIVPDSSSFDTSGLICNQFESYRIRFAASGTDTTASFSNVLVRAPFDTIRPATPVFYNATVWNSTQNRIQIFKVPDSDVNRYRVLVSVNGAPFTFLANVLNPTGSPFLYAHTGINTVANSYMYRVQAVDTCASNTSDTSARVRPILLSGTAGNLRSRLSWTPFVGYTLNRQRVQRLIGSVWTDIGIIGGTDTTYTDSVGLACNVTYSYRILAEKLSDTLNTFSNTATVTPFDTIRPIKPSIQVSSITSANSIDVNVNQILPAGDVNRYELFGSVNGGAWTSLNIFTNLSSNPLVFTHSGLNTQLNRYRYRVQAIDSCANNRSDSSDIHQPVVLNGTPGNLASVLSWPLYVGFSPDSQWVQRKTGSTWLTLSSLNGTTTTYTDQAGLACNVPYTYRLVSFGGGVQSLSSEVIVTPFDTIRPDKPSIVVATVLSATSVEVRVNQNTSNPDVNRYQLFAQTNSGPWTLINTFTNLSANPLVYQHTGLNTQTNTYRYRVQAIDSCANNRSDSSNIHQPVRLSGTPGQLSSLLSWPIYVGFSPDSQQVQRKSGSVWQNLATLNGSLTNYTDTNSLGCNVPVTYRIISYGSGAVSSLSSEITVTPFDTIAPLAPVMVNASVSSSSTVTLSWQNSASVDVNRHRLFYTVNGGAPQTFGTYTIASGVQNNLVVNGLNTVSNVYCFYVVALDSCSGKTSPNSNMLCVSKLSGTAGNLRANLTWTAFSGYTLSGYQIQRKNPGSSVWNVVGTVAENLTQYTDSVGLLCNNTYTYRINGLENGGPRVTLSNEISVTPYDSILPPQVDILSLSIGSPTQANLRFLPSTDGRVNSYRILLSTNGGAFTNFVTLPSSTQNPIQYTLNVPATSTRLCVQVVAIDSCSNQVSSSSETHCAVLESGSNGNLSNNLRWKPYLGYSVSQYQIERKSGSSWVVIGTTTDTFAKDTPLPCNVAQTYRIAALQSGGSEIAYSNEVSLTPFDTIKPAAPSLNFASVYSTGSVHLNYNSSSSGDVDRYRIYRSSGGAYSLIATVPALAGTTQDYYDSTASTSNAISYCYYVQAIDSCSNNISAPSDTDCTVKTTAIGNSCARTVNVSWTPYIGFPSGVSRYDIYRSDNGSAFSLQASVVGSTTSFGQSSVALGIRYCYQIVAVANGTGYQSNSNAYCLDLGAPAPPDVQFATVTQTGISNGEIQVKWTIPTGQQANYVSLFYSPSANAPFTLLQGNIPVTTTTYTHTGINTQTSVNRYYLTLTDSCNNTSQPSSIHRTMDLNLVGGQIQHFLKWTAYEGWPVSKYRVYRLTNTGFALLDSINGSDTTYRAYPAPCNYDVTYKVEAVSASGLISSSDTAVTRAIDTIPANAPIMRNATVLSDNRVQIQFLAADSSDIFAYSVQRSINGGTFSHINYMLQTTAHALRSYIDTVSTLTDQICYRVVTLDSCLNATPSDTFCLIQLNGQAQQLQNTLRWTSFKGYPIAHYRIERWNGSAWAQIDSVLGTDTVFTDGPLNCGQSRYYRITGVEQNGLNRLTLSDTIHLTPFDTVPPSIPVIRYASVQSRNSVGLRWTAVPEGDLGGYKVFVRSSISGWRLFSQTGKIDSILITGLNTIDSTYSFALTSFDTCGGNQSDTSILHTAIQLTGTALNKANRLNWSAYVGFNSIQNYTIQTLQSGVWSTVDTVAGNITTYLHQPLACNVKITYRVIAVESAARFALSDTLQLTPYDTIPPVKPVIRFASIRSNTSALLKWTPVADGDVGGYRVFVRTSNSSWRFATATGKIDSAIINGLNTPDSTYSFAVVAFDTCAANQSDTSIFHTTIQLSASPANKANILNWSAYVGFDQVTKYTIEALNGTVWTQIDTVPGSVRTYTHQPLACNVTQRYRVIGTDISGLTTYSDTAWSTPYDTVPPATPVLQYASIRSNSQAVVHWTPVTDGDLGGYRVFVRSLNSGWRLATLTGKVDSALVNGLNTPDSTYQFALAAFDTCAANLSDTSIFHQTIQLKANPANKANVLNWSAYQGFSNIQKYTLEVLNGVNWVLLDTVSGTTTTYTHQPLACNVTQRYRVWAQDNLGTLTLSDTAWSTPYDTVPPTQPVLLYSSILSNTQAVVKWTPVTDGDLAGYRVFVRNQNSVWRLALTVGKVDSAIVSGLNTPDSTYRFAIAAFDTCAANLSDTSLFHQTIQLKASPANLANTLNWSAYQGFSAIQKYYIQVRNAAVWNTIDSTTASITQYTHQPLACNQAVWYRVVAQDASGLVSVSDTARSVPYDTIPPVKPVIVGASVLSNTSVKLDWTLGDPQIGSYEIYHKTSNGAWTLVSTVGYVNTFTITGLNTLDSINCFRIAALDTCAFNRSVFSDQHCTVQLGGLAEDNRNTLNWTPYVGFGTWKYFIELRQANGSWSTLDSVASSVNTYQHGPIGCNVTQTYRIRTLDLSNGTISYSDTLQRTPFDTIPPVQAVLQSVSVTGNNQITLNWQAGPSPDVNKYEVWRAPIGGTFSLISTVVNQTNFVDNVPNSTLNQRYTYYIIAIDSCNAANRSVPSLKHNSMNLNSRTGACSPAVVLNWNPYVNFPGGLSQYQILRSSNGGNFTQIATVPASDTTYTDPSVNVTSAYCYKINAVSLTGGLSALSDSSCISPAVFATTAAKPIVRSTVLSTGITTGSVQLDWDTINRAVDTLARGYRIYRSTVSPNGPFTLVQTVLNTSQNSFVHTGINTRSQRNYYTIKVIDSCGFEGDSASLHSPILLQVQNQNLAAALYWNKYVGKALNSLLLERSDNGGAWFTLATLSVNDTSFRDTLIRCQNQYAYRLTGALTGGILTQSDSVSIQAYDLIAPDVPVIVDASVIETDATNGKVVIRWNSVSQDNRKGYTIYRKTNNGATVSFFTANTGTGILSYTDSSINTVSDVFTYQVSSNDSCGNESAKSVLHKTTNLTVVANNGANSLSWTAYAGFDSLLYLIERKTASTPYITLSNLPSTKLAFDDSLTQCDTVYYYRITAQQLNGSRLGVAFSDTASAKAFRITPPTPPVIKRATITQTGITTGKVLVEWYPSVSRGIMKYRVFRKSQSNPTYVQLAELGRVYSFVDTGLNTRGDVYTYQIECEDSCKNISLSRSSEHGTMVLVASPGNELINLSWNSYVGWNTDTLEVWRDGAIVASLPGTTTSWTDTNKLCINVYNYKVIAHQQDSSSVNAESNFAWARPFDNNRPDAPDLKVATLDSLHNDKIIVKWNKPKNFDIKFYQLQRRDASMANFVPLYSTTSPNDTLFEDSVLYNIADQSICYRLLAFDYCGNVSDTSNIGCTIDLSGEADPAQNVVQNQLSWNAYRDFKGGVDRYEVYRSDDSGLSYSLLAILPSAPGVINYTDNTLSDTSGRCVYYVVGVEGNNAGSYNERSRSDTLIITQPSRIYVPTAFTANEDGLNDSFGPKGTFIASYTVQVFNRWGETVFQSTPDKLRWDGKDASGKLLPEGSYQFVVTVINLEGKRITRTGNVWLMR